MINADNGAVWLVDGVHKRFRRRVALSDISLQVGHGVTGLLGPNGAGKTTLLRILATTLAPSAGALRILGQDPAHEAARVEVRRSLGYLPQETRMYGEFTAFDFVDYVAILKEMTDTHRRRDEVRRVLTAVGLEDRMHSRIRTLSGGMRRSVMLAQALLGAPEMLILDEPTDGLDPAQRVRFEELVSTLASTCAVLMSTHLNEDIATVCAQVIVLDHGLIRFAGSPADLAAVAEGHVWESENRDPAATLSRLTSNGRYRNLGDPPPRADTLSPSVEDGYMLLTNAATPDVLT
jgi:ABC-2 type transport system ATP-binding protein